MEDVSFLSFSYSPSFSFMSCNVSLFSPPYILVGDGGTGISTYSLLACRFGLLAWTAFSFVPLDLTPGTKPKKRSILSVLPFQPPFCAVARSTSDALMFLGLPLTRNLIAISSADTVRDASSAAPDPDAALGVKFRFSSVREERGARLWSEVFGFSARL